MKRFIKVLLIFIFFFSFSINTNAKTLKDLKNELAAQQAKKQANDNKKKQTQSEINSASNRIKSINGEIANREENITRLTGEIATLEEKAKEVESLLCKYLNVVYDDTGSIGKRYRRQDAIGTPFCVTIDFDTIEDNSVTIRERDTMQQVRLPIDKLVEYLNDKVFY